MKELGLEPNLGTMNAMLDSFSMIGNPRQAKNMALSTMSEFKRIGIEPSLASYFFLLTLFCKESKLSSTIVAQPKFKILLLISNFHLLQRDQSVLYWSIF